MSYFECLLNKLKIISKLIRSIAISYKILNEMKRSLKTHFNYHLRLKNLMWTTRLSREPIRFYTFILLYLYDASSTLSFAHAFKYFRLVLVSFLKITLSCLS